MASAVIALDSNSTVAAEQIKKNQEQNNRTSAPLYSNEDSGYFSISPVASLSSGTTGDEKLCISASPPSADERKALKELMRKHQKGWTSQSITDKDSNFAPIARGSIEQEINEALLMVPKGNGMARVPDDLLGILESLVNTGKW